MTLDRERNGSQPVDVVAIEAGPRKIRTRRRWAHMPLGIFWIAVAAAVSFGHLFPKILRTPLLWQAMVVVA